MVFSVVLDYFLVIKTLTLFFNESTLDLTIVCSQVIDIFILSHDITTVFHTFQGRFKNKCYAISPWILILNVQAGFRNAVLPDFGFFAGFFFCWTMY